MSKRSKNKRNVKVQPGGSAGATAPSPRLSFPLEAVARARQSTKPRAKTFSVPAHPPSVAAGKQLIAMDSAVASTQSWANLQLMGNLTSAMEEGLTFLGYAYLAELAQRPEYRVMSEIIAMEMTRKFIRFTTNDDGKQDLDPDDVPTIQGLPVEPKDPRTDRISDLEKEFRRLDVAGAFRHATELDGFFGRGHIYIDTGDTQNPDELTTSIGDGIDAISQSKMRGVKIRALRTVEPVWCYPTGYNSNDPLADDWYRPNSWYVQSKVVHSSRLITLIGREVPDLLKPTYSFGGLSLTQVAKPYVDNWLQTRQSVNDLVQAFTTWVLKTDLGESIMTDGSELFKRAEFFNAMRDTRGLMILDKDTEDFANVSTSLAGLDALQSQAQEHMASVSHIPLVKLTGISPSGLNATSEFEMEAFYTWIGAFQEKLFRAPLTRLLHLIMLSLWGEIDEGISFEFEALWSLSEVEQANVRKTNAETDVALIDAGIIDAKEARERLVSDDESGYNSLSVDELPDLLEEEEQGLEIPGGRPNPPLEAQGEEQLGQEPAAEPVGEAA